MDKPTAGLRKRQQITKANRLMFLWIAGVSVIVGVSVVLAVFLIQKIVFNEKVIGEKNKTVSVLTKNIAAVNSLRDNIRVLNTDEALSSTRLNDSDKPIQSVLDALPADANSTSLASSLQTKLLTGVSGVAIDTITVQPVSGVETSVDGSSSSNSSATSSSAGAQEITFAFTVSTDSKNYVGLQQVLERVEKSIRPFNVTGLTVQSQGTKLVMSATGVSYYNTAQNVQLSQKVVKP